MFIKSSLAKYILLHQYDGTSCTLREKVTSLYGKVIKIHYIYFKSKYKIVHMSCMVSWCKRERQMNIFYCVVCINISGVKISHVTVSMEGSRWLGSGAGGIPSSGCHLLWPLPKECHGVMWAEPKAQLRTGLIRKCWTWPLSRNLVEWWVMVWGGVGEQCQIKKSFFWTRGQTYGLKDRWK